MQTTTTTLQRGKPSPLSVNSVITTSEPCNLKPYPGHEQRTWSRLLHTLELCVSAGRIRERAGEAVDFSDGMRGRAMGPAEELQQVVLWASQVKES